ncbi:hypothetical protein [Gracilibacillus phocaeensis]|uniref:hypothetical protein n=1 Tax=Gracilibacillus phocaeensis TaxID=2042304 RepID=UPI0013EF0C42|nr:hypothetical protein [Gracilibacillus phocaeensis]
MSDYFRMIKDGEKQPQVTPDKIDWEVLAKSERDYEKHLQERECEENKTGK